MTSGASSPRRWRPSKCRRTWCFASHCPTTPPASSSSASSRKRTAAPLDELDPDALREQLAVVGRVTEEQLRALGALEVQVRRVLPGEADSPVDLDVFGRTVHVGVGAV